MSATKYQAVQGDRRNPWSVRLYDPGRNNDLTGLTVNFAMYQLDGTVFLASTTTGITIQPGLTFTADATTDKLTAAAHGLQNGWEVIVSTSGTLPTGLSASARYFVRDATPNTFRLSLEPPEAAYIDITGAGSGTHTLKVLGHVQYAPSSVAVGTVGTYRGKFVVTESTLTDTYPNDADKIEICIVGAT